MVLKKSNISFIISFCLAGYFNLPVQASESLMEIESFKRKLPEQTEEFLTNTINKRPRIEKKETGNSDHEDSDVGEFLSLPPELQSLALNYITDKRDKANCRLVCRQIKAITDEKAYSISLQNLATLRKYPQSFSGSKLCLSGWAPTSEAVNQLLSLESCQLSGQIFVSSLIGIPPYDHPDLQLTLTVATDEHAELKLSELERKGLSKVIQVRSRQSLWNDFIKTNFIENYRYNRLIMYHQSVLSPILEVDTDGKVLRKILEYLSDTENAAEIIKDLARIPEDLRPHLALILNEADDFLSYNIPAFINVIKIFSKIDDKRKFFQVSKLLSITHSKCQNGIQVKEILESFASVLSGLECKEILLNLSQKILPICKNGSEIKENVDALANIRIKEKRQHIISLLEDNILAKCQNGSQVRNIIEGLANISSQDTRKDIVSLLNDEILVKCQDGTQAKRIIDALAAIQDRKIRDHIVQLLHKKILIKCQNGFEVQSNIDALAAIQGRKIRNHIVSYYIEKY